MYFNDCHNENNKITRIAYLLTTNETSNRTQFSKNILQHIGFNVKIVIAIPHVNKVLSNKLSMLSIYEEIKNGTDNWGYVFEDDINILEEIKLDEIIKYENISNNFFYLGLCKYGNNTVKFTGNCINNNPVYNISGYVRGLHAIGLSKEGASELIEFSKKYENMEYMDMILELYSIENPANIVRYELESYILGHRGIIFQDRNRFPSSI
jgi:hypothetical protein